MKPEQIVKAFGVAKSWDECRGLQIPSFFKKPRLSPYQPHQGTHFIQKYRVLVASIKLAQAYQVEQSQIIHTLDKLDAFILS
ncbi:hypothetical protein NIES2135_64450 (plasmid) [Leptolyngbya boryana NIES-2135]|jgi:hypothetical protein|uniref:Uncharacterized protein n=1 Tax=Leptolyngbya boryana NIES-2135 TaxID=1973484 RepID=A0A1Z4JSC4_LEPBY|nr:MULTISPECIES: hypothetical protein [Leptolyngbya]BAY59568.1 hypothetical protein NIES2135_64450 [Leptolyngbya boryana NIES-2135]MBD2371143.1 hypothetical protein [Leptolyngbya sp. FACHB-161]MBD2377611.1 hypothetical protein [Leptolyngbya sp. FACHB-238]MBD2402059.1 hypothetical protein [Leptolyngbya sp. FACHB-239]MBD2408578.1 hypothetical protein [Leptolyngbya sp. FACHB-402]